MEVKIDADQLAPPIARQLTAHDHAYYDRLRRKLRWQFLIAYCAPLAVLTVYFHYLYSATLTDRVDGHMRTLAESRRNTADLFIQERVANLRNALHRDTMELPSLDRDLEGLLSELQRASSAFVDVGLFGPSGNLQAYGGPYRFLRGKDYSGQPWYQQLLASERDYVVSDVFLGFRGRPHFIVAVRRASSHGTWVLRGSLDPDKFGEFVGGPAILEGAQATIVNRQGKSQTASRQRRPELEVGRLPKRSASAATSVVTVRGRKYLRAIAWLTVSDWALLVQVPSDEAYAPLARARASLAGIMLVTLGFIVWVAVRSTRKLVGQLEAADEAQRWLAGSLFNAAKLASVGEIGAGVAHEINNPLAIIYQEAALMKDLLDPAFGQTIEPAEIRERLTTISAAAIRGRDITRKLLAFARQHNEDFGPVKIENVVERVLRVKEVDLRTLDIEVSRDFPDGGLPEITANENQIEQVLLNLVNNARDAIGRDGRITIRGRQDKGFVQLDVEDTGHGMTPDVMSQVFFPFFTTKGVGKGTGLGLSISYGIVKSMRGRIEVQSEVGVGTTFSLFFPLPRTKPGSRPQPVGVAATPTQKDA